MIEERAVGRLQVPGHLLRILVADRQHRDSPGRGESHHLRHRLLAGQTPGRPEKEQVRPAGELWSEVAANRRERGRQRRGRVARLRRTRQLGPVERIGLQEQGDRELPVVLRPDPRTNRSQLERSFAR